MDRIQQSQPATLSATWERAGLPVDPGVVTAVVTYDSTGSTISPSVSSSSGASRTISLTPAQTASLDWLTIAWTAADGSVLTTHADIVGGYLFSIAQLQKLSPLQDTSAYPIQSLLDYRTLAEMALEDICGVAFVPRYTRETMFITNYGILSGSRRRIRDVRQITTFSGLGGGVPQQQPVPSLSGLQIVGTDEIYMPTLWNWFSLPIYCAYEHGHDYPPPRVGRAAMLLARRWVVESPWDERTTGFRTRDGGAMAILTASHSNAFDLPEVEAVATAYGTPMIL